MDKVINTIQEFASLFNIVILIALFAYLIKIIKYNLNIKDSTIEQKNSTIENLKIQLENSKEYSVEGVEKRIESAEKIKHRINNWEEDSNNTLQILIKEAIEKNTKDIIKKLKDELTKRSEIKIEYNKRLESSKSISVDLSKINICGTYSVTGRNPESDKRRIYLTPKEDGVDPTLMPYPIIRYKVPLYFGRLDISKDNDIYSLKWTIESFKPNQTFFGTGMLNNDILSVIFHEDTDKNDNWYGVISYQIIGPEILIGNWIGFDEKNFGSEECRKLIESKENISETS